MMIVNAFDTKSVSQEEQYTTALPRQPGDIFFISFHAFLVHPEKLVVLGVSLPA